MPYQVQEYYETAYVNGFVVLLRLASDYQLESSPVKGRHTVCLLIFQHIDWLLHFLHVLFFTFFESRSHENSEKCRFEIECGSQKSKIGLGRVLVKLVYYTVEQIIDSFLRKNAYVQVFFHRTGQCLHLLCSKQYNSD